MKISTYIIRQPLLILFILIALLNGCTTGLTVASSGAQAVYNRNSISQTMSDQYITMQSYRKLYIDSNHFKNTNISIATFHNEVLLTGEIPDPKQRKEAEETIKQLGGVKKVYNLTVLNAPVSSLTRISDAWITTKVRTRLLAASEIDPSQFKVVTENGTVYLMGIIPPEQAEAAIELARTTDGVQNVVKIFSYLRISKT